MHYSLGGEPLVLDIQVNTAMSLPLFGRKLTVVLPRWREWKHPVGAAGLRR
jgi:hypothetical protein